MELILNTLEKLCIIKSWNLADYDRGKLAYAVSKLKIDKNLHLIALFTRDVIYLVRY